MTTTAEYRRMHNEDSCVSEGVEDKHNWWGIAGELLEQLEQVSKLPEIWKDRRMCEISATGFDYNELLECANELQAILKDKS
jgi:hypothetical protein